MKIVERLSLSDSVSFSNVCMSFRCAAVELFFEARSSAALPWLVMSGENHHKIRTFFSALERKVIYLEMPKSRGRYIWGSIQHWLVMVMPPNAVNEKHQISLLNPFLGNEVFLPDFVTSFDYCKLVASGSPDDPSAVYMLVGTSFGEFALWTQGCKGWRECGGRTYLSDKNGVFCNGYFYILEERNFYVQRIEAKSASRAIRKRKSTAGMKIKYYRTRKPEVLSSWDYWIGYLVESRGEILLVTRLFKIVNYDHRITYKFMVYRLDLRKSAWISVEDLGDRVLFVGHKCSRSGSAKELGIEMGNCIFFTNEYIGIQGRNEWSTDGELYDDERVKGSNMDEWGCYRLGSDAIYYPSAPTNWQSTWISAPLWYYGLAFPPL